MNLEQKLSSLLVEEHKELLDLKVQICQKKDGEGEAEDEDEAAASEYSVDLSDEDERTLNDIKNV